MLNRHLIRLTLLTVITSAAFAQQPAPNAMSLAKLEQQIRSVAARSQKATVGIIGLVGMGSGAVIDKQGLVLTNAHVAAAAPWAVIVFSDGRRLQARRVGIHFARDLALYQLPKGTYEAFSFGKRPAKGEWVLALGHPGGVKADSLPSLSAGQVTGTVESVAVYGVLNYGGGIESDVAIYSGNSGGPMVDLTGKLVGINGAMNPSTGAAFSLSPKIIHTVLPLLRKGGITLQPGLTLRTDRFPLSAIYGAYSRMVKQAIAQRLKATPQPQLPIKPEQLAQLRRGLTRKLRTPAKRIWERRHAAARQKRLTAAFAAQLERSRAAVLQLVDDQGQPIGLATVIAPGFAVTRVESARGSHVTLQLGKRKLRAKVIRVDTDGGLALLDVGDAGRALAAAKLGTIGSWLVSAGARGKGLAVGVLSVRKRKVRASAARLIASLGQQQMMKRMIDFLKKTPGWLGLRKLARLLEQNQRRGNVMELGNLPRAYPEVFQHDGPIHPTRMGGPVLDRQGRWVGINLARAHHGTTYAVTARRVLHLFAKELSK